MKNRNRKYTNGDINIYWRADLCVHNTYCYRTLRSVFDPSKRPWVNPLGADSEQIKVVIEACPTDALMFRWCDDNKNNQETSAKLYKGDEATEFGGSKSSDVETSGCSINLRPNGPIIIDGECQVEDSDGTLLRSQKMYSLCRCGGSKNQPYCDGSHFSIGYKDR